MRVRNIGKCGLGFPSGAYVDRNEVGDAPDDDYFHPVVQAWFKSGKCELVGDAPQPAEPEQKPSGKKG